MTDKTGSQRRYMSDRQIDAYRRDGYASLPASSTPGVLLSFAR